MADYSKLKVVDLKEVLKERGLQVSGKKADLIARLEEDDAIKQQEAPKDDAAPEEEAEEPAASEGTLQGAEEATSQAEPIVPESIDAGRANQPDAPIVADEKMDVSTDAPAATDPRSGAASAPEPSMTETVSEEQVRAEAELPLTAEDSIAVDAAVQEQEETDTRPMDTAQPISEPLPSQTSTIVGGSRNQTPDIQALTAEAAAPIPIPLEEVQVSVQHIALPQDSQGVPLAPEEVLEDAKKRKRRSQSPIPSGEEVATKKSKTQDGSPRTTAVSAEPGVSAPIPKDWVPVEAEEDTPIHEEATESIGKRKRQSQSPVPADTEVATKKAKSSDGVSRVTATEESETQQGLDNENGPTQGATRGQKSTVKEEADRALATSGEEAELLGKDADIADTESSSRVISKSKADDLKDKILSPTKQIPNAKFKGLFETTASGKTEAEATIADNDRYVEPALHPATTALYIRNFMRPLQPNQLRDHLESLAKPPNDQNTDQELVRDFFLDNVKTHCLVQFHSISAASRVRLALHDRVWPDESTRKALWVDFIPEEKVSKWMTVERDNSSGSRSSQKRFEVVYEKEDGEAVAYLQEADGAGGARGFLSGAGSGRDQRNGYASGAAGGNKAAAAALAAPQAETGKGFEQLDDLFRSTAAKPKLYFQPVSESVAEKRLDLLAAGRGGGRSDEMRRFSFENRLIVDKGPEFGSGWRGGRGGRGGGGGGFGRGYGARYDGYRGGYRGGDSYR